MIQIFSILISLIKCNIDLTVVSRKIRDVVAWCNSNKLKSMPIKLSMYILFKSRRRKYEISGQLLINESVLESVESTSFLGICIDENLTWKKHINSVCNVLSKKKWTFV